MTPRPGTRALAAVVAIALLGLAVVIFVEIVAAWTGHVAWVIPRHRWLNELRTRSWDDPSVRMVFAAAGVVGLALLVAQVWPRRPAALAVSAPQARLEPPVSVQADIDRHALESRLARVAGAVDGVRKARARVRRKDLVVEVDTRRKYASLEATVREQVDADLIRIHLQRPRPVRVRVRRV